VAAAARLGSCQGLVRALDQERAERRIGGDIGDREAERGETDDPEHESRPEREAGEHQPSAVSSM
jgi:hypothetical protein